MPNLVEAHERVKDFEWTPSYATRRDRYPTKYRIPRRTKDPFRHLIRDYCSMEQEKDDRQYGAMEDVLARSDAPAHAHRDIDPLCAQPAGSAPGPRRRAEMGYELRRRRARHRAHL